MTTPARENPWGLTPKEALAMTTLCEQGCNKLAARALCRSQKTIEVHLCNAGKKMPHRTPLLRYLAWDRWLREQKTC